MALSDNCAVALDELVKGVVDYGNLAYFPMQELPRKHRRLIESMHED